LKLVVDAQSQAIRELSVLLGAGSLALASLHYGLSDGGFRLQDRMIARGVKDAVKVVQRQTYHAL
jgi:hypothetical protein